MDHFSAPDAPRVRLPEAEKIMGGASR